MDWNLQNYLNTHTKYFLLVFECPHPFLTKSKLFLNSVGILIEFFVLPILYRATFLQITLIFFHYKGIHDVWKKLKSNVNDTAIFSKLGFLINIKH